MFEEDRLSLTFQPISLETSDVFMLWVVRCFSDYNITTISANRLTESRVSTQIAARAE